MKIYTKKGDFGQTSLATGVKVPKSDRRVELYGTADELNSTIGVVKSFLRKESILHSSLEIIQNLLFELGAELAGFRPKQESCILEEDITFLENQIDQMQEKLEPLKKFILPGGTKAAAFLHISRTVSRKLEREMVKFKEEGLEILSSPMIFINRLSDYFFVAARFANLEENIQEPLWTSRTKT
ncbi:cob(I)yrinic acid a,c-diamide adenosyltransferase [Leptospira interrogans]|uniref:cob(I)yrinic acid a,c-diamide adenosyltransferase n=1 Tax=Leptospira interrogans TaxID=173 RepID=UPI000297EEFF|nr:cob(I)yrinic acid a,c-diamide adenosyltransferase [Leptospira interrogans]EKR81808.1 ATP:cob(I)alamin adenosyltransferase [Leptospira interrogans str. UI 08452]EMN34316.1 ATP:cob(I)alamin adenosyltransferase [Leptospira interrogans serovar Medanensis str. L0448]EMN38285.1 ATP:cob(I)alamin adenosyltransferase [Leptospira interrogans str. L0996]EMN96422.1 ATP:cob(I)alamin adenosyltransferase [Leptospira interrogans serovar Medanensis str. UT053]